MVHQRTLAKRIRATFLVGFWLTLAFIGARPVHAQGEGLRLTNISGSGSASQPLVWAGPGLEFQAFWWDAFDGVTTSVYQNGRWSSPVAAPLEYPMPSQDAEKEMVATEQMASIVAGTSGWAHAIWQGPMDRDTELIPLFHSAMPFGQNVWSEAHKITEGASAWKVALSPGNKLHLVYFQAFQVGDLQPGAYYRRSLDGGLTWSGPTLLDESLHYRRTDQATSHIDLVADGLGYVLVTWNDPRTGEAVWARSADAGESWWKPTSVANDEAGAENARMLLGYGGTAITLWTSRKTTVGAGLYQRVSTDGAYTLSEEERLFSHLRLDTLGMGHSWAPSNDLLVFSGSGSASPMLLSWDPVEGWAAPRRIDVEADLERQLADTSINTWVAARSGGTIALLGASADQEIWGVIASVNSLIETAQALPSVWTEPLSSAVPGIDEWGEPVNLSRSGAASHPRLVGEPGGSMQAFWMDQFDGLVSSYFDGDQWYVAQPAPILAQQVSLTSNLGQETTALMPLDFMPQIVGDGGDRVHAFWLVPPKSSDDERRHLMHAVLTMGEVSWGDAQLVDDAALAWHIFDDGQGGLYLLFVRSQHTEERPSGVYHASLRDDGTWSAPVLLEPSIYARIFEPDDVLLDGAADGAGHIFVAWNDQRDGAAAYALSQDGGNTFGAPLRVGVTEGTVPRIVSRGPNEFTTILSLVGANGGPALYQQFSSDGAQTWTQPERVFGQDNVSLEELLFLPTSQGDLVAAVGLGGQTVGLLVWDAARDAESGATGWSDIRFRSFDITTDDSTQTVRLGEIDLVVSDGSLTAIGQGSDGEIWIQMRSIRDIEWAFEELPPWSELVPMATTLASELAMVRDDRGDLHVLWGFVDNHGRPGVSLVYSQLVGGRWSGEHEVLQSPFGFARQPDLVSYGDKLYAAWNGGQYGLVYFSQAFARDALSRSGWSEPLEIALPPDARGATQPDLFVDLAGTLHLVYAVPWNEHRGIYYVRSTDGAQTWSAPMAVFDAAKNDWPSASCPSLVVDMDGRLIVTFGRMNLPDDYAYEGLYSTFSIDHGETWREPQAVTDQAVGSPQLVLAESASAHVVWRDLDTGRGWRHSWTDDGGHSWHSPTEVSGAGAFVGEPTITSDLQGTLYWAGLATDREGETFVRLLSWIAASERWLTPEDVTLGITPLDSQQIWLAQSSSTASLDLILAGSPTTLEGQTIEALYHMERSVVLPGTLPQVMHTPEPTLTPTRGPAATATSLPKPTVNVVAPSMDTPSVSLGPLSLPLLSLVGLAAVGLLVAVILVARLVRRRSRYGAYYYYHR